MRGGSDNLRDALRALSDETRRGRAPERVRAALMAEMKSRARRRRVATWWPAAAAAAAAVLAIGIWLGAPRQQPAGQMAQVVEEAPVPAVMEAPVAAAPVESERPKARLVSRQVRAPHKSASTPWFFYAGYGRAENGQVVSIRVSAATAAQFGVDGGGGPVAAQVFIGDDGLARAIRFVR